MIIIAAKPPIVPPIIALDLLITSPSFDVSDSLVPYNGKFHSKNGFLPKM
jgi:hypothetical protein